jgi:hypothetical protein
LALFSIIKAPLSRRVFARQWPLNTSRWCRCKRQPQFRYEPQAIAEQVPWHRDLGHLKRHVGTWVTILAPILTRFSLRLAPKGIIEFTVGK